MMFCPECGQKFTGEGLFCTQCGTRKPDAPPVIPVVETPAPVVQPVAPPVTQPVAPPVAQPVVQPVAQPVQQQPVAQPIQGQVSPQQKSSKNGLFALLIGIVIGAVIVGGIYFMGDKGDDSTVESVPSAEQQEDVTPDIPTTTVPEVTAKPEVSSQASESITSTATDAQEEEIDNTGDYEEVIVEETIVEETVEDTYLLPTDTMLISVRDLQSFTPEEIRLVRNEIYARYGYTFTDSALQEYFEEKSWYQSNPELNAQTFNNNMLSDIEFTNIELIVEYEASLN